MSYKFGESRPYQPDNKRCKCGDRGKCKYCDEIYESKPFFCNACNIEHGYTKKNKCDDCNRDVCDINKCVNCQKYFCAVDKNGIMKDYVFHCSDCYSFVITLKSEEPEEESEEPDYGQ